MSDNGFERTDVAFVSGGMRCVGWLYRPSHPTTDEVPAVVMATGFSGVKEMGLRPYCEAFARAGFATLIFDFRHLGESEGTPRGHVVAHTQLDDLRAALSFLGAQPGVDADRLALWGTSFGGGHALFLGALDRRVKVVVTVVPALGSVRIAAANGHLRQLLEFAATAHSAGVDGGHPSMKVVDADGGPAALGGAEAYEWLTKQAVDAPNWQNSVTLESLLRSVEYAPASLIDLIAPTPLLIQAAEHDAHVPIDAVRRAFENAGDPKRLDVYPCGHFDMYDSPILEKTMRVQVEWLRTHL